MYVTVTINLSGGDTPAAISKSAEDLATEVLTMLGGDPEKDSCSVTLSSTGSIMAPPVALDNTLPPDGE